MTTQQIIKILDESMVYIDFGNHPGKDRIPREAALRNCIVMTNKSGSAANDIDIPIPAEYKFSEFNTYEVFSRINMVFKIIGVYYQILFSIYKIYRLKNRN